MSFLSSGYLCTLLLQLSITGILRGLLGMAVLLGISWLLSTNRKAIKWRTVIAGLSIQLVLALAMVFKVPGFIDVFVFCSKIFVKITSFTKAGTTFLFANFDSNTIEPALINFAIMVLPTIVFFSALTSLLYYLGILQRIVYGMAWLMRKTMKLSGAESLAAAGNIFLGQTESPFLIKPYLGTMTKSELMCLMSGGMATIAGGVLASYIQFLGGDDPAQQVLFAKHLLMASVMSAPAAVVAAKMLVPETDEINEEMVLSREKMGANILEAVANGTTEGVKLAVNVAGMLLVFTAFVFMGNWMLDKMGGFGNINEWISSHTSYSGLSFQFLLGYAFSPVAWLMGVDSKDIFLVGQLLGEKTILNEFYAYTTLGGMKEAGRFASEKSMIMATYMLCGFSNIASIGIQIGGIGTLIPGRKGTLSKLGVRALVAGTIACLFTAVVVGMFL